MNTKITDDVISIIGKLKAMNNRRHLPSDGRGIFLGDGHHESVRAQDLIELLEELQRQRERTGEAVARVDDLERGGRVRALALGLSLDAPLFTTPPSPSRELLEKAAQVCESLVTKTGGHEEVRIQNDAFKIAAHEIRALMPKEEGKS